MLVELKMPLVRVKQGEIEGLVCHHGDGSKYIAFKGVPYAKPPLGDLRFKAPQPPEPWQGVRNATEHGPVCPQYNERMNRIDEGSEDCLYLNVYTPTLAPSSPLPVMVYIHGGGFYTGSGNSDFYGPEYLMEHNVVLVTFNYRLEVLGFLCLDTADVPGNAGMKDQVACLNWVKENIANFGGDRNNVTIFGCSAGGASTGLHLISNMSRGLFDKAICQSGICLNEWAYNIYARQRAFQLGKFLGKDTEDPEELLNFLRSVPASSLFNIQLPNIKTSHPDLTDSMCFVPVVEKCGSVKFLDKEPVDLVKSGRMADVPVVVGFTSGDGIEVARKLPYIIDFMSLTGAVVPREIKLKISPSDLALIDDKVRKQYFDGEQISMKLENEVVEFETHRLFAYNTRRYARYHALKCTQPVYLYKFTAETERNFFKKQYNMEHAKGVCHSDEVLYLYNVTCLPVPETKESKEVTEQFVRLWTNFAATGCPTTPDDAETWRPFTDAEQSSFIIGTLLKSVHHEDGKHMQFWDDIYDEVHLSDKLAGTTEITHL